MQSFHCRQRTRRYPIRYGHTLGLQLKRQRFTEHAQMLYQEQPNQGPQYCPQRQSLSPHNRLKLQLCRDCLSRLR